MRVEMISASKIIEELGKEFKSVSEAKMTPEELLAEVEDAEDRNDRWGSAVLVADFLGDKEMKDVAETMSRIQDKVFGSLPPGFAEFREFLKGKLKKQLMKKVKDKSLQNKFQSAF